MKPEVLDIQAATDRERWRNTRMKRVFVFFFVAKEYLCSMNERTQHS